MTKWNSSLLAVAVALGATLSAPMASAQDQTLRIMGYQATFGHFKVGWQHVIEQFEAQNPGVKIEDIPTAFGETLNQITVAKIGGNAPDLMVINPVWMAQLDALEALEPIRGLIDDADVDKFGERGLEDLTFGGEVKALTLNPGPIMMVYNRDLMTEAGLNADQPPKSWPELKDAVNKICALPERNGGKTYGIALRLDRGVQTAQWMIPVIWGMGGDVVDEDGEFNFTSPKVIDALEWYRDIVDSGCAQAGATVGDTRNLFAQGRSGFIFEGPWIAGLVKNLSGGDLTIAPDSNIWVAPMPADDQGTIRQFGNQGVIAISSDSENKALAAKFVDFLLNDPDMVDAHFERTQIMSTGNMDLLASGAHAGDVLTQEFVKYLPVTQALPLKDPRWLAAMDAVVPHIQGVMNGADAQSEARGAQDDAQRALKRR